MITDAQLFKDLVKEFNSSQVLHQTRLNLSVEEGIVTISGRVNSLAERKAVERAAKRVAGIRTLILEIRAAAFPVTVNHSDAGSESTALSHWARDSGAT